MTRKTKSLVILVGLPASGKSTARAQAVASGASKDSFQYSTDDHIDQEAARLNKSYSEIFRDFANVAKQVADQGLEKALENGQNVLWDQTNLTKKKRRQILKRFPEDYITKCICILPPFNQEQEDELQRRLKARAGKEIPDFVMKSMRDSFQLPIESEGFDQVIYFDIYGNLIDRNDAADLF